LSTSSLWHSQKNLGSEPPLATAASQLQLECGALFPLPPKIETRLLTADFLELIKYLANIIIPSDVFDKNILFNA